MTTMQHRDPQDGKATVPRPTHAQTDCQACPYARTHDSATEAHRRAHDHADTTGHTLEVNAPAFARPLTVVGTQPRCGRCESPLSARIATGPSITDQTNQPCGCTPTAEGQQ